MELSIGNDLGPGSLEPDDKTLPPGFGKPGETIEEHERARVHGLAAAGPQPPVPLRDVLSAPLSSEVHAAKAVVRQVVSGLANEVSDLARAVHEQNTMLRGIDVPLEQVADSHERATHSFETLRADIDRLSAQQALTDARVQEILKILRQARG